MKSSPGFIPSSISLVVRSSPYKIKLLLPTPNRTSSTKLTRGAEPTTLPLESKETIQSRLEAALPFKRGVPWMIPPIFVGDGLKLSGTMGLTVTLKLVETVSMPPFALPPLSVTFTVKLMVPCVSGTGVKVIVPVVSGEV